MIKRSRLLLSIFALFCVNSNYAISATKVECIGGNIPMVLVYDDVTEEEFASLRNNNFTINYNVTKKGEPKNIKVKESKLSDDLVNRVVKVLKKWKFKPAFIDGKTFYQKNCEFTFRNSSEK